MIETLKDYGFIFIGTCNCAGPRTQKYRRKDYKVYWNKAQKVFRIKHHGKAITPLLNENQIDVELAKYFQKETQNTPA